MMYLDGLKSNVILELVNILAKLNPVEIVTPVNRAEIQTRWIKNVVEQGIFTNPNFIYDREYLSSIASYGERLACIKRHLMYHINAENGTELTMLDVLAARIEQGIMTTELAASVYLNDDIRTAEMSYLIYGAPSPIQIADCYDVANSHDNPVPLQKRFTEPERATLMAKRFTDKEIKFWLIEALNFYRISPDDWTIDIGSQYASIEVRPINSTGRPLIGIPAGYEVDGLKLLELIGHKIGCHLRSIENAKDLFLNLLGEDSPLTPLAMVFAKSNDELLDEGQARLSDVLLNGTSALPTPYYDIAIDLARHGYTFLAVAEAIFDLYLVKDTSLKNAAECSWACTYSVFRGSTGPEAGRGYAFDEGFCPLRWI